MLKWSLTLQSEVKDTFIITLLHFYCFKKTLKPYAFEIVLEQSESLVLVVISCLTKYSLSRFYFFTTFMLTNPYLFLG